jgi:hypothetical protein
VPVTEAAFCCSSKSRSCGPQARRSHPCASGRPESVALATASPLRSHGIRRRVDASDREIGSRPARQLCRVFQVAYCGRPAGRYTWSVMPFG